MRKFLYIAGLMGASMVFAQQPYINSLDKSNGTANEVVTISGAGFSSPTVYFGKGKVTTALVSSSSNVLEVRVPATATYGPVTVVNGNGLSASSSQLFSLSFDNDFAAGTFSLPPPETAISTGDQLTYDLCLCDFDGDDLLDAVITHDNGTNIAIELNNNASPGTFIHSLQLTENSNSTYNVECGDLNGDGKPDLVITSSGAEPYIHIYQNTSTAGNISFNRITRIQVPTFNSLTRSLKRIRIADIDGDGKPDIVVGNLLTNDNNIFVYLNTSSGTVSFNTTENTISVSGISHTSSIYPGDLNNDGKIDLVILPFNFNSEIYILKNTSLPGSVSFESAGTIGPTSIRFDLTIGDFNNDGLNDIATTRTDAGTDFSSIEIAQNSGNFNFLESQVLQSQSGITLEGIDIGDMNGDGFADVVAASLTQEIVYTENTTPSVGSDITFSSLDSESTGQVARNIRVGDINDDGKPDIVFTNKSSTGQVGEMGYIINDNCMTPVITPNESPDLIYCNGIDFILTATNGHNVTYDWTISGETNQNTGALNELNLSSYTTDKTVSVTATQTGCSTGSTSASYDVGGASLGAPSINDPGLVCIGDNLTLVTPASATNYSWTGPNGFTSTASSPVINNVTAMNSGTYTLIVDDGDCLSPAGSRLIEISGPPVTSIEIADCSAGTATLAVPYSSLFTYEWFLGAASQGAGTLVGSTRELTATPGSYTVVLTDGNNCSYTSEPVVIYASTAPTTQFTPNTEVCIGVEATFSTTELGDNVTWEIDDPDVAGTQTFTGTESGGTNTLNHTFATAGAKTVRLITTYSDGIGCSSQTITVSDDPSFVITPSATTKCYSETVTLTLTGASTGNGDSWTWSSDDPDLDLSAEISNVLTTSTAATYTATYTTGTGCQSTTSSVLIENYDGILVSATAESLFNDSFSISGTNMTTEKQDTIIFDDDQTSVTLEASNSVTGYVWTANKTLSGDEVPNDINGATNTVVVTPSSPNITVTVSGETAEGCDEPTKIVIISGSLKARKSFSPNGDTEFDCWTINNSDNPGLECTVYVFDSRGATIFEGTTPFTDDCVWDGNYNGKPAPEGVYYFAMKCDDSSDNQTGAILLAR